MNIVPEKTLNDFKLHLIEYEKSKATVDKYMRDVRAFFAWLGRTELNKEAVLCYKNDIVKTHAPASVNSMLASLNSFFDFCGLHNLKVRSIKIQRKIFAGEARELTKAEYERLLCTARAKGKNRLCLLMQTICSLGLRVSELQYITVSAVRQGSAQINCKGKMRTVIMPKQICKMLNKYIRKNGIKSGSVFVTKNGNPIDRSNIWSAMKALCRIAGVPPEKVFPHNLRHLFARTYYSLQKDVVRLADILGHSSINTTRIYTMECGEYHRAQLQKLGLLLC
ncbi:MAG: tyrosine-type recombinase/integrase [Clostridia bacterium]|nr:tyrosine-type recombinase/integrase [Clostridia bacterium]